MISFESAWQDAAAKYGFDSPDEKFAFAVGYQAILARYIVEVTPNSSVSSMTELTNNGLEEVGGYLKTLKK